MINISYIHEFDIYDIIEENYNESMNEIRNAEAPIFLLEEEIKDKLFFNESIDDSIAMMESLENTFFDKIGKAIINIVKRFKTFVKKITTDIKEKAWSAKSNLDKKEMILKKCPNLPERVKISIDKNLIDLSELRSFEDFNKNYENLLDELEKAENTSKIKAKWEKMKRSISKNSDAIIKAGHVAVAISSIAAVLSFGKHNRSNSDKINVGSLKDVTEANIEKSNQIYCNLKKLNENENAMTKLSILAHITADYERISTGKITLLSNMKLNCLKKIDTLYNRFIPNAKSNSDKNIRNMMNKYANLSSELEDRMLSLLDNDASKKIYTSRELAKHETRRTTKS